MKVLKWIVIVIVGLIAILLVISLFMPKKIQVRESIVINTPAAPIYAEVTDFRGWGDWSVWNKLDPNMINEYSDVQGGVGAKVVWKSDHEQVGNGQQEIIEATAPTYMKSKMNFEGWEGDNFAEFILEEGEEGTTVIWTMDGAEMPMMFRLMGVLMKPAVEQSYRQSLSSLKEKIESLPTEEAAVPEGIQLMDVEAMPILCIKDSCATTEISSKLGEIYGEIVAFIQSNEGLDQAGMPLAIYHTYDPENDRVVLEAGIPYSGETEGGGRVMAANTPSGKVVMGVHYGSYDASEAMHNTIDQYIANSSMELIGSPWEIYANDPTEVDSAAVETHIYYPVQ